MVDQNEDPIEDPIEEQVLTPREEKNMFTGVAVTVLFAVLLLAGGIAAAVTLVKTKEKPGKVDRIDRGVLVGTEAVVKRLNKLEVDGQGTVVAARELIVMPEVSGRITAIHDRLEPGGFIPKGERIIRINAQETTISVTEQQTMLEQARAQLALEKGQQVVAKKEWELFKGDKKNQDGALALRGPQLKTAEVAVDAAQARLSRAKLNLSRTSFKAPFDAFVISESAEVGQLVSPNMQVARLVGTESFWVQVSVPIDNLAMIQLPNANGEGGATAVIEQRIGNRTVKRNGTIIRLLPNLDPAGRQARLLVEIKDPVDMDVPENALLLDAYVRVVITGKEVVPTISLPRRLLHDGDKVYVYKNDALEIRPVEIIWRQNDSVLISGGLEPGEEIINTRLTAAIKGMKLRKEDKKPPEEKKPKTDEEANATGDDKDKLAKVKE